MKNSLTDESKTSSKMKQLLDDDKNLAKLPQPGDLVKGEIISISKKEILIDIAGLTTGIIRGKELYLESNELSEFKEGDEVEATVMEMENEDGMIELSFRFAGHQKAWEDLNQLKRDNKIVKVTILDANKGGLLVKLNNLAGFLPVSQLNPEHYPRIPGGDKSKILEKLKSYVGLDFEVKVLDADAEHEKLIVSEKIAWEESQSDVLDKYKEQDIIEGEITAITDFGLFVKFGENLEGLAHISELAWQRIDNPNSLFKVGEKIKAQIIKIEGSKIFLSLKSLQDDPWKDIEKKYKIGDKVKGTVLKINPFGLFVELDKDIHGLAHISELSNKPINNLTDIEKIAKPNEEMEFTIMSIEPKEHRLGLSLVSEKKAKPATVKETEKEQPPIKESTKNE